MRKMSYAIVGAVVIAAAGLMIDAPAHGAPLEPSDRAAVAAKDRIPPVRPLPPRKPIKPAPPPREICISRPVGEGMVGPAVCWIYFQIPGPNIHG